MNKKILVCLFIFSIISVSFANEAEVTEDEDVIVLTADNFDQVIAKFQNVLVKFYAPWCGHCKSMAPAYSKAAAHFKSTSNTRLAKLDSTVHQDVSSRFGISGYPTLRFFTNGKDVEYKGGRSEEQLVDWVNKKTQPASSLVSTVDEVDQLVASKKLLVVFFGQEGTQEYQEFLALSNEFDDVTFAHSSDASVQAHFAPKQQLVLFKQFDEKRNDFEGKFELEVLKNFIQANKIPLVSEFSQEVAQAVFGNDQPAVFLFVGEDEKSVQAKAEFEQVAKQLKGQVIFSWAQVAEGFGKRLGDYIGVTQDQVPTVRLVQNKQDTPYKYNLNGEISAATVSQLVKDFFDGKLTASLKSEEVPENNNGPVKVVVGKNFEQIVLDQTKDVLIEFYAPWCGHCKTLAPIFDELGEAMKQHPSVVIAKCDATANEIPGVGVKSFPTIIYFPANNKALPGIEYNGGRNLEDFVKYLEENKSIQWQTTEEKNADL